MAISGYYAQRVARRLQQAEFQELIAQGWSIVPKERIFDHQFKVPDHLLTQTSMDPTTDYIATKAGPDRMIIMIKRTWTGRIGRHPPSDDVIEFYLQLHGYLPGYIRVVPMNTSNIWNLCRSFITTDEKMESDEFNRQSWLLAEPDNLSYQVFSPNLMSRWLDLGSERPLLHVEGEVLAVIYSLKPGQPPLNFLQYQTSAWAWAESVERSGALEKLPT